MGERGLSPAKVSHFVRPLSDPSSELAELGGKGASLARLTAAGFPVPDGFCVTTGAYCAYREAERMPPEVAEAIMAAYAALGSPAGGGPVLGHLGGPADGVGGRAAGELSQRPRS